MIFFFFKQKTAYELRISDWSSDACSSDLDVLHRAEAKARKADVEIEWRQGFASDAATLGVRFDKTVTSLVFHQVPIAGKRSGVAAMAAALQPGGELHIADYAAQT